MSSNKRWTESKKNLKYSLVKGYRICFFETEFPATTAPTDNFVDLVCLKDGVINFDEIFLCLVPFRAKFPT